MRCDAARRPARRAGLAGALLPAVLAACTLLAVAPAPAAAQQQSTEQRLRAEQSRLDKLRSERQALEQRRASLQNTVHDLAEEVDNLNQQISMTASVVSSLDDQLATINDEVDSTTADLVRAQDELTVKQAILQRRVVDIYKRGPLYSVEVMLSASSFGDLVARYKYLHLVALRDRVLVRRVEDLRNQIDHQRGNLVRFQQDIEDNLQQKADEERRLRDLRAQQATSLSQARRSARETDRRIAQLAADEKRLTDVVAELEAERVRASRGTPNAGRATSAFSAEGGHVDWPVTGPLLYSFGRVVNPNNTTVRWNGIGIEAPAGTPVHAVAAGRVRIAEPFGTYGLTVIIEHPGGDYSVYGSLQRLAVKKGQVVSRGEVIGYVGSSDPALGPHLHFELRPQGRPVDPLEILKPRP